ncbi:MAG: M48 family metallopeptidase [Vicinamibacterales bacterium]|nr:M48 family metallopeptidase [Vicinamibacterales bacterium]
MLRRINRDPSMRAGTILIALFSIASLAIGQTKIVAPDNKYSPQEDLKLGREAAQQVEEQMPLLRDSQVETYIGTLGDRIIEAIPPEYRHPEFRYSFKVVNVRDINAFALPGGPMYVNRGMIEAAGTEGEVVGVIAHEVSHVALRHGTAQASKATKYEVGSMAGQILGAIIGGGLGQVVSMGSQFGFGTAFLRFGREYEKQADILGAQIMARANYDARDMANMFKTIEKTGGGGGPEFLSDHPNPANRSKYIEQEAQALHVSNPIRQSRAFDAVKARLRQMPQAPTTEEAMKKSGKGRGSSQGGQSPSSGQVGTVSPPSAESRPFEQGNLFRVSVPTNWRELAGNSGVTFAPEGGYGNYRGQSVFTHGMEFGVNRNDSQDLRTATDALLNGLAQSNPQMKRSGGYSSTSIDGHKALTMTLSNVSDATGRPERVVVYTTQMSNGSLFYAIGVAPSDEFGTYQPVFTRIVKSVQLNDNLRSSRY